MKKFITVTLLAFLTVSLLVAGGAKESQGDQSLEKIVTKGVFVMGLDDSFPPMGYRDENNEIVGFDVDLAKEVTRRMGVTLKVQPIDWNAKEQELNTGNIDCIWNGFTITAERRKMINFSDPYVDNAQVAVVRNNTAYQTLADLAGKSIGLQAGSTAADAVANNPSFAASVKEVVEVKDNLTALMDLEIGGVEAVVLDLFVAIDNITRSGKDFRILDEHLSPEEYGVGFRKNDQALRDEVQKHLNAMAQDGTLAQISTAWFGEDITVVGK